MKPERIQIWIRTVTGWILDLVGLGSGKPVERPPSSNVDDEPPEK